MFISLIQDAPFIYVSIVLAVMVSIIIHELAHGWVAIRLGDETPRYLGRMTFDPLVHMGPFSIAALFLVGLGWGQMPIDPTRMRGKYAEAQVAFAGPMANIVLAVVALTGLGLWWRYGQPPQTPFDTNVRIFVHMFGAMNVLLAGFNLVPVPPLDGSRILANFHRPYAMALGDPGKQGLWLMSFMFTFMMFGVVFRPVLAAANRYVLWLAGI